MNSPENSPACLSYLTIYNPSLKPLHLVEPGDEDAQEQAHIVFYTSRERAVSRDKLLRQIGLAKALVSFADAFGAHAQATDVHSQGRRMVTISPEHGFWIHACLELRKRARSVIQRKQPQAKGKAQATVQETEKSQVQTVLDYDESSVNDIAVKAQLQRGYEELKASSIRHGSFTSTLDTLGQEALALQLERFFTVWAWSWDVEAAVDFADHLGIRLHPYHREVSPKLEILAETLPDNYAPCLLLPPYIIPSTRYIDHAYPIALPRHLMHRLAAITQRSTARGPTEDHEQQLDDNGLSGSSPPPLSSARTEMAAPAAGGGGRGMLSIPTIGIGMDAIDVRKWSWPGYLTFSKGRGSKPQVQTGLAKEYEDGQRDTTSSRMIVQQHRLDGPSLQEVMESSHMQVHASGQQVHMPGLGRPGSPALSHEDRNEHPGPLLTDGKLRTLPLLHPL
ncbi:hypothetical protein PUNSTDRAFT_73646 [Punctularia strigosozonata HHB-11173 SS5]|uniref:uncharacterized protein n=1 Tax=Punctularia strigosozonata (strain HHB-11173) TaxID=741275 RepID=UPI000441760F|nr:uncharacterized protein PUNSTDRAFT_73646 [Punctularia strigosozonata HHB-11173 SS5]EIN06014.1 hypothetical protein PUNSTDRAFT_73646 [Punctularia strigosozonata HHB-11173 SS5]